jgi:hypothetical protein
LYSSYAARPPQASDLGWWLSVIEHACQRAQQLSQQQSVDQGRRTTSELLQVDVTSMCLGVTAPQLEAVMEVTLTGGGGTLRPQGLGVVLPLLLMAQAQAQHDAAGGDGGVGVPVAGAALVTASDLAAQAASLSPDDDGTCAAASASLASRCSYMRLHVWQIKS